MNYSELTWRYFAADERVGCLTGARVTRGTAGSRAQGTWVQFDLAWQDELAGDGPGSDPRADTGFSAGAFSAVAGAAPGRGALRVKDGRFLAFGCPHTIAVAAWLVEQAVATGHAAGTGLPESPALLARRFGVPIEKLGRLLLVEDAWLAATSGAARVK